MHGSTEATRSDLARLDEAGSPWAAAILESLQSTAPVGFAFIDCRFRIVRINPTLAALNGVEVADLLGRTVPEAVPELWSQIEPPLTRALRSGQAVLDVAMSRPVFTGAPAFQHGRVSFYPIRVGAECVGVSVLVTDVTEQADFTQAMTELTEAAVGAVAAAIECRDPYTAGHQRRVATLATAISTALGIEPRQIDGIRIAAGIHDIGKIAIPAEILTKPGTLTPNELALIREHPQTGHDIMRGIPFPWPVADMILQHHERLDGSGYPLGLTGTEIGFGARIIAVADVVEAMASHRPYREGRGLASALAQIQHDSGTLLDADAVGACLAIFADPTSALAGW